MHSHKGDESGNKPSMKSIEMSTDLRSSAERILELGRLVHKLCFVGNTLQPGEQSR
jgi:hypothetical protein